MGFHRKTQKLSQKKLYAKIQSLSAILEREINTAENKAYTIQLIFSLTATSFACRPTSIIMPQKYGIGSRRATPARHFLIYLFSKQLHWSTYKVADLFNVSDITVFTSINKFHHKLQTNKNYRIKIQWASARLTKQFTKKRITNIKQHNNPNQLKLQLNL